MPVSGSCFESSRICLARSLLRGPLSSVFHVSIREFPDMSIISENKSEDELISGLRNNQYQFIILSRPLEDDEFICEKYDSEQLYVSLPKSHRFAKKKKLSFRELNGESFLMLSEVGIWDKLVREEMPDSKFIIQNDYDALGQLIESSILPNFATDITIRTYESMNLPGRSIPDRVLIPITDDSATVIFYLISDKKIALKYKVRK